MAEGKKNIAQLRAEVRSMMASIQVAPSKMCRADLERMKEVYGAAAEKDKTLPPAEKKHGGRTKAMEVEGAEKDGIAVPKKPVKEKTQYALDKEKKAKATIRPGKLADGSGSGSNSDSDSDIEVIFQHKSAKASNPTSTAPKRVLTDEHRAKMAAGRAAAKKQQKTSAPEAPAPPPAAAPAAAPASAPDSEMYVKLPVFRLG